MRRKTGFTLIETLVSLSLLLILLGLAYNGIDRFMRVRQQQDVITATQAKLRRTVEVFTQDLRSAVFGAIIDEPYASGEDAVSFALLKGNSGFKVYTSNPAGWSDAYDTVVIAENPGLRRGDRVMIVNQAQKAVILKVTGVRNLGGNRWHIRHNGCKNTLSYYSNTLLFGVDLYGIRYDEDQKALILNEKGNELPLAFGIEDFEIEYLPSRAQAQRLKVHLTAESPLREGTIARGYTGVVELSNNATFDVKEVVACER